MLQQASARLQDRLDELEHELAAVEEEIDSAGEDDDLSSLRRRQDEVTEALARARHCQRKLETCDERFKREALRISDLATETTTDARSYLRDIIGDLSAYFALEAAGSASTGGPESLRVQPSPDGITAQDFDPTHFLLPKEFRWIPIREIAVDRELAEVQTPASFAKGVSYEEMRAGFDVLRREILPLMVNTTELPTRETFAARDAAAGVGYSSGLLRVYEAFFGDDPIHVDRGRDGGLFSVTSGRHRIKVAMDAGWTAVPGTMSDLSSQ